MDIKELIKAEADYSIELRRYFHQHPEISMKEFKTCARIEQELDTLGIPHKKVGETGIFAWIDGKKSTSKACIMLRADIDALAMQDLKETDYCSKNDGACHACGHDVHIAGLLTASKVLKSVENEFSGQVRLFFQQGEEFGQGARIFVAEGLLKDCQRAYTAHVTPRLKSGQIGVTKGPQCASCDHFIIEIEGKGAHVSTPHLGIDAVYIASQIVVQLQSIVARNTNPLDTVVVGVGSVNAGTQYNIVAQNAKIEGTTRSFSKETRQKTNDLVTKIAQDIGATYGAKVKVIFNAYCNPVINNDIASLEVQEVAKNIFDEVITDLEKNLTGDDFADFQEVVPGVYAFLGIQSDDVKNSHLPLHHGLFDIDEKAMLLSSQLYVEYALSYLNNN